MSHPDHADVGDDTNLWDEAGFVESSQYRRATLDRIRETPATPSTIAEDTGYAVTHISRSLRNLRDRDMVELLVPEERRKGRIYGATEHGQSVGERVDTLRGEIQ